ncbi:MAG: hypothetical protein HUN04_11540 [Desulfobacter sp.]|nr:MAG: hypothetical protein HUN04_11540 [Desulfobacter sp.]
MSHRDIIHLNIADFAAGIEACIDPALRNEPLVIAPTGAPRAVVYDMNEPAFKEGIRKGMPLSRVKRQHRGVPVLPPRFNRYERAMKDVFKQGLTYTPAVESGCRDGHLFLDITGTSRLYGPPPDVAFRLKKSVKKSLGLEPIWSLATSKLVAKVATRMVKPLGEYIVGPGEEEAFLGPLPLSLLPGLSKEEIRTATRFNLVRISQIRTLTPAQMDIPFPGRAAAVRRLLKGIDPSPVSPSRPGRLRADHEFADDTNDADELTAGLALMAAALAGRLCSRNETLRSLTLTISYSDGVCHTESAKAQGGLESALFRQSRSLFRAAWKRRVRIRHMALTCTAGPVAPVQADLFASPGPDNSPRTDRLSGAMAEIRARFGNAAVRPAAALAIP